MILPLHNYGRGNLRYYLELLLHSCARKKQMMKKVIVLQLKNDYYDGNLWALKWSKSMIALAVNDYTTIKKEKTVIWKSLFFAFSTTLYFLCNL